MEADAFGKNRLCALMKKNAAPLPGSRAVRWISIGLASSFSSFLQSWCFVCNGIFIAAWSALFQSDTGHSAIVAIVATSAQVTVLTSRRPIGGSRVMTHPTGALPALVAHNSIPC